MNFFRLSIIAIALITLFSNAKISHAQNVKPDWADSETPQNGISENERSRLCTAAKHATFSSILDYAENTAEASLIEALDTVRCSLAIATSQEYSGNMLHAAIRNNPNKQDIVLALSNGLLRNGRGNPELEALFVRLVLGEGADMGIFPQLQNSWDTEPSARGLIENSARIICLSIDRYTIADLQDLRNNECMTPPFDFPIQQ